MINKIKLLIKDIKSAKITALLEVDKMLNKGLRYKR